MKDPICGMTVTDRSFHYLEQRGQIRYFCGPCCKARFATHGSRNRLASIRLGWVISLLKRAVQAAKRS